MTMTDVFLARQPGTSYWFRDNREETIRHRMMLEVAEQLAKLAGINTRPREGKTHGTDSKPEAN